MSTIKSKQQPEQHYALLIEWSDEDQAYTVSFPEWEQVGHIVHTHGDTYREAGEQGQAMLEFLMRTAQEAGETLPEPRAFAGVSVTPIAPHTYIASDLATDLDALLELASAWRVTEAPTGNDPRCL